MVIRKIETRDRETFKRLKALNFFDEMVLSKDSKVINSIKKINKSKELFSIKEGKDSFLIKKKSHFPFNVYFKK